MPGMLAWEGLYSLRAEQLVDSMILVNGEHIWIVPTVFASFDLPILQNAHWFIDVWLVMPTIVGVSCFSLGPESRPSLKAMPRQTMSDSIGTCCTPSPFPSHTTRRHSGEAIWPRLANCEEPKMRPSRSTYLLSFICKRCFLMFFGLLVDFWWVARGPAGSDQ